MKTISKNFFPDGYIDDMEIGAEISYLIFQTEGNRIKYAWKKVPGYLRKWYKIDTNVFEDDFFSFTDSIGGLKPFFDINGARYFKLISGNIKTPANRVLDFFKYDLLNSDNGNSALFEVGRQELNVFYNSDSKVNNDYFIKLLNYLKDYLEGEDNRNHLSNTEMKIEYNFYNMANGGN